MVYHNKYVVLNWDAQTRPEGKGNLQTLLLLHSHLCKKKKKEKKSLTWIYGLKLSLH